MNDPGATAAYHRAVHGATASEIPVWRSPTPVKAVARVHENAATCERANSSRECSSVWTCLLERLTDTIRRWWCPQKPGPEPSSVLSEHSGVACTRSVGDRAHDLDHANCNVSVTDGYYKEIACPRLLRPTRWLGEASHVGDSSSGCSFKDGILKRGQVKGE